MRRSKALRAEDSLHPDRRRIRKKKKPANPITRAAMTGGLSLATTALNCMDEQGYDLTVPVNREDQE
jgi:hypothetical protein